MTYFSLKDGMSTKPDVDALLKAFPPESIKPGEFSVTDAQVQAVIGLTRRNRNITNAWIKRLFRDHNIHMYRQKMVGFFCPTPEEVYAKTHPTYEHVSRAISKQMRHVAAVKPQNDFQRVTQEHQHRVMYVTKSVLRKDRMNILPPSAVTEVPKIAPPKAKSGQ